MTMTDDNKILEALQAFMAPAPAPAAAPAIPDAIAAQARELDALRDVIKVMKDRESALRNSLLEFMNTEDVKSISDGVVAINISTQVRTGVDRKRLEALYPKVLADCATETPVTQVRVTVQG